MTSIWVIYAKVWKTWKFELIWKISAELKFYVNDTFLCSTFNKMTICRLLLYFHVKLLKKYHEMTSLSVTMNSKWTRFVYDMKILIDLKLISFVIEPTKLIEQFISSPFNCLIVLKVTTHVQQSHYHINAKH